MAAPTPTNVVFALGKTGDNRPLLVLGTTPASWQLMLEGKTHTFDLKPAGMDVQIVMFQQGTKEEVLGVIKQFGKGPITDLSDKEFPIK